MKCAKIERTELKLHVCNMYELTLGYLAPFWSQKNSSGRLCALHRLQMGPNNVYELSFIEIFQKYATSIELLSPEVVSCFHEITRKALDNVSRRETRPQTAFHARIFKHVS